MRQLFPGWHAEVEVEVAVITGRPGEVPAHALAVGKQLLQRRARHADHRDVAGLEMGEYPVEAVSCRRAARTAAALISGTEHEVVDDELRPVDEQFRQRPGACSGLQRVLLLDRGPGKLLAVPGELIPHPRALPLP